MVKLWSQTEGRRNIDGGALLLCYTYGSIQQGKKQADGIERGKMYYYSVKYEAMSSSLSLSTCTYHDSRCGIILNVAYSTDDMPYYMHVMDRNVYARMDERTNGFVVGHTMEASIRIARFDRNIYEVAHSKSGHQGT